MDTANDTSGFIETNNVTASLYQTTIGKLEKSEDGWPYFKIPDSIVWGVMLFEVIIGLIGNLLLLIMTSDATLSHLSYSVYLKFLAVSDSFVLSLFFIQETENEFHLAIVTLNTALCKVLVSLQSMVMMLSPWLVAGLALDKCFCICFPFKRAVLCTKKKAIFVCSSVVAVSLMGVIWIMIDIELVAGHIRYSVEISYYFMIHRVALSSTLPCLVILVINVILIVQIQRSNDFRNMFRRSKTVSTDREKDSSTRPLVLISVLAFVTMLPYSVSRCLDVPFKELIHSKPLILNKTLQPLFKLIYLLNFGQNFFILISSSANYRKIIRTQLRCCTIRRNPREPMTRSTTNSYNSYVSGRGMTMSNASLPSISSRIVCSALSANPSTKTNITLTSSDETKFEPQSGTFAASSPTLPNSLSDNTDYALPLSPSDNTECVN